jgi:hypothetical protein
VSSKINIVSVIDGDPWKYNLSAEETLSDVRNYSPFPVSARLLEGLHADAIRTLVLYDLHRSAEEKEIRVHIGDPSSSVSYPSDKYRHQISISSLNCLCPTSRIRIAVGRITALGSINHSCGRVEIDESLHLTEGLNSKGELTQR